MDLITVVLLLQLAYRIDKAYAGTELQPQSLQCTNDYLREMVCTWDAGLKVNCNTDYTLQYQKTAGSKKGTCFPNNFRVDPEREGLSAQCICRFAVPGFDSTDEYKVEVCSDGRGVMNSTIRVSETIKTAAPHILSVVEDEGKNLTLLWNSRYSKNEPLQELLMFEVMYRKRDSLTEEYEKIEELGAVKHKIPWLSLETGNQYIFRVRAKLDMFNATWSDWSPVDIKPKGILICYNDYIDEMVCVWNASMQINCSGEYTLSFTRLRLPFKNDSCVLRNVGVGPNSLSTRCECKMPKLADGFVVHDMYIVEVWHRENAILLTHVFPCETIKPRPPHNLSVSRSEKNNFNLTWKIGSNVNEKMDFQVSLRKKEEPDEKAQLINVSDVSLEIIRSYLDPGHSYVVKVRSFSREYHSQYSDWSLEVEWQNYHTAALYLLKIATPIVCVSLLVVIISCYLCTRIAKLKLQAVHDI
ncbi:cytokine receptor common subunit beta-like [Polyodon spathula]|uniref:cytokine receptor common subunit beta-like n=1 Tax=Polyodon spathula TaxID=7913 RepID=UPI001B7DA44F|nr:cytokine receptor common subunit beta-like [Polyodon spathula]